MKKLTWAAAALSLSGCWHATRVEKPDQSVQSQSAPQPDRKEGGAAAQARDARHSERPDRPPLAAGPGGLLVPGAVKQIQNALASRGYLDLSSVKPDKIDEPTSAAVRRFQSDQGIARTGNPDHETVRRLGLDAEALFRKSAAVKDATPAAGQR
jgi:peptidoglycan hydrolase-like protein with peptidoglycan-binding domain